MTKLEELQALTREDLFWEAVSSLVSEMAIPENEPAYIIDYQESSPSYDQLVMHESLTKPTPQEIDARADQLKAEKIANEESRLAEIARREALQTRFDSLDNLRIAITGTQYDQPNTALLIKRIIDEDDTEALLAIEQLDATQKSLKDQAQAQETVESLRDDRDTKLYQTDWTQLADAPLDSAQKAEYREYRQYLRDVPYLWDNQRMAEPVVLTFEDWQPVKAQYVV